ncbi:MAG: PBP1A family penicillin-binding protein [Eubacteriales bacterium]|nr:PBP1A family penicillin-binding protein [Eubacteriales bacterium]
MKHARKNTDTRTKRKTPTEVKKRTEADYRRKYLYEDESSTTVRRQIASAGYKTRSLDSYIPADKLESKVRSRNTIDDTKKIDTAKIAASENHAKRTRASSASSSARKSSTSSRKTTNTATSSKATSSKTASSKASSKRKTTAKKIINFKSNKYLRSLCASLGIILVVAVIVLAGIGAGMYTAVSNDLKDMNVQNLALNYSSFVYYNDADGNAIEEVQLHHEGERRVWVDSEDISINLKNAAVAIEDERFYQHNGIDLKRTFGAAVKWGLSKIGIGNASYGGSTITQQLIKNITNEKDRSVTRKFKEIMRAIALEKQIDNKDTILTMYLNISYFSNQCNGVEAASNLYFSKKASELSPAEAALIVGITQRPTYYDPIRNPNNALAKRNTVLKKMYDHDYITKEEYEASVNSPLGLSTSATESRKTVYSYFVDAVISDVINDLVEKKGYSSTFAEQQVFSGGLKIYTTMDKSVQEAMENVYENRTGFPSNKGPQSAMVVLDPKTGEIKGLVGGAGKKTEARGLNRATQSKRQPGSSIKPISVYAPGIELGKLNSATVLKDEKISIGDWSPSNSYSGYKGNMVLSKCIEISSNTTAVKALQLLGIENSYNFAKNKFNLSSIIPSDKSLASLALGGLTDGVTVRDMAGAYGALANGGMYNTPHTYTKVLDSTGEVLLEFDEKPHRAVSEATAFIMTDMLSDVINGRSGTARTAKLNNIPAYGKTGTTNDNKDKWFVGYTTHYVGAVWFGFDTPKNLKTAGISNNPSCVIWKNVMNKIHSGKTSAGFVAPSSVKKTSICSNTGKLASSGCSYVVTDYFVAGNIPSRFCKNQHTATGASASSSPTASVSPSSNPEDAQTAQPSSMPIQDPTAENSTSTQTQQPTSAPVQTPEPIPVTPPASTPATEYIPIN